MEEDDDKRTFLVHGTSMRSMVTTHLCDGTQYLLEDVVGDWLAEVDSRYLGHDGPSYGRDGDVLILWFCSMRHF
jgi:hypothetical protein